jgi:hypothetical protein
MLTLRLSCWSCALAAGGGADAARIADRAIEPSRIRRPRRNAAYAGSILGRRSAGRRQNGNDGNGQQCQPLTSEGRTNLRVIHRSVSLAASIRLCTEASSDGVRYPRTVVLGERAAADVRPYAAPKEQQSETHSEYLRHFQTPYYWSHNPHIPKVFLAPGTKHRRWTSRPIASVAAEDRLDVVTIRIEHKCSVVICADRALRFRLRLP